MDNHINENDRLEKIFFPHAYATRAGHVESGYQFVHYTSAESALKIINSKCLWMRNTNVMSDYQEVRRGFNLLNNYFKNSKIEDYRRVCDSVAPGALDAAIGEFSKWSNDIIGDTYIASVAAHSGGLEDSHGRLSMWRAFGGTSRVALVLRPPKEPQSAGKLGIVFSPVAYLEQQDVSNNLESIMANIRSESDFLKNIPLGRLSEVLFNMLFAAAVCLKHPGFFDEREWRAIYLPKRRPSTIIESEVSVISGVPQKIYKLPLDYRKAEFLGDLDLAKIFVRLVIGPTQYPSAMRDAFAEELTKIGVADAHSRIHNSEIPIRS